MITWESIKADLKTEALEIEDGHQECGCCQNTKFVVAEYDKLRALLGKYYQEDSASFLGVSKETEHEVRRELGL